MNKSHYNKDLKTYARAHRLEGTKGEAVLWKRVLSRKQTGYQFNRQFAIDYFIVDFICCKLKLIVEVDGSSHFGKEQGEKDYKREQKLRALGYEILRFNELEVLHLIDEVAGKIQDAVFELSRRLEEER